MCFVFPAKYFKDTYERTKYLIQYYSYYNKKIKKQKLKNQFNESLSSHSSKNKKKNKNKNKTNQIINNNNSYALTHSNIRKYQQTMHTKKKFPFCANATDRIVGCECK